MLPSHLTLTNLRRSKSRLSSDRYREIYNIAYLAGIDVKGKTYRQVRQKLKEAELDGRLDVKEVLIRKFIRVFPGEEINKSNLDEWIKKVKPEHYYAKPGRGHLTCEDRNLLLRLGYLIPPFYGKSFQVS